MTLGLVGVAGEAGAEYQEVPASAFLTSATSETLTRFVGEGLTSKRPVWMRKVREWARGTLPNSQAVVRAAP